MHTTVRVEQSIHKLQSLLLATCQDVSVGIHSQAKVHASWKEQETSVDWDFSLGHVSHTRS